MTGIIIQSRLGSTRLPRKALLPIAGKPMIAHVVERCLETGFPVVLAVPEGEGGEYKTALGGQYFFNDKKELCPIAIFEGHPTDVLDRYYECAKAFKVDPIVRITGDCPLVDPEMIKRMIAEFKTGYFSNCHPIRTVPAGMDIEIFEFRYLEHAWKYADKYNINESFREHVTKYFYELLPEICETYSPPFPDSWKVCIDTQGDYERVRAMIEEGKYPWLN